MLVGIKIEIKLLFTKCLKLIIFFFALHLNLYYLKIYFVQLFSLNYFLNIKIILH